METETPQIVQKESIKLERGMKGNYSWEIKLLEINLDRLDKLNAEMLGKYGDIK